MTFSILNLYILFFIPSFTIFLLLLIKPTSLLTTLNIKTHNLLIIPFSISVGISFFYSLCFYLGYTFRLNSYQFIKIGENLTSEFLNSFSIFGIDGLSLCFILLTPFIIFLCSGLTHQLPISFNDRKLYYICLLTIELFLFLAFTTTNILVFYFSFEAVLLPIFLLIGRRGSNASKKQAANYIFLYTVAGSVLMLFAILTMIRYYGTCTFTIFKSLLNTQTSSQITFWWWCFFIGFAVKIPVCPFHLWLPEAHVEAPAAGSVILAALLLKLGSYGFLRVLIEIFQYETRLNQIFATTFGLLSVIWGCGVILSLTDIKRVIAFSSIIHMNLIVIGIFGFNYQAIQGSIAVMISHGLCSAGLFMCIGMLYSRYHTRDLPLLTGVAKTMPVFSFIFGIYSLANMALPGTFNFVAEVLLLLGIFLANPINIFLLSYAIVLSAAYSLILYSRICFGTLTDYYTYFYDIANKPYLPSFYSETIWQLPIIFLIILWGIFPFYFLELLNAYIFTLI